MKISNEKATNFEEETENKQVIEINKPEQSLKQLTYITKSLHNYILNALTITNFRYPSPV